MPLLRMTKQLQPVDFKRRWTVFAEGEPADRLYIIVSGKVKFGHRLPDGREHLLAIMGPPEMLGGARSSTPARAPHPRPLSPRWRGILDRDTLADGWSIAPRSPNSCYGYWPAGCGAPTTN